MERFDNDPSLQNKGFFCRADDTATEDTSPEPSFQGGVSLNWNDFTPDDRRKAAKTFSRYFLGLSVFLLVSTAVAYIVSVSVNFFGLQENPFFAGGNYLLILNAFSMYVCGMGAFYLIIRGMRTVGFEKRKISVKELLVYYCISQALVFISSTVGNFLNDIVATILSAVTRVDMSITNDVGELIESSDLWITIPLVAVAGPVVEELLFRKFLIDRVSMYGDKIAIVVSAIAFGLFHGNLYQILYAAVLGLLLAYVYTRTRNILYPILLHVAVNLFSTLSVLLIPFQDDLETLITAFQSGEQISYLAMMGDFAVLGIYMALYYGVIVAGVILFITKRNKIFVSDRCEIAVPKGRRFSTICLNVGVILFFLITLAEILIDLFSPLMTALSQRAA